MNPDLERKPWRGQENSNFRLTVTGGAWCLLVPLHTSPRKKNLTIGFGVRRSTLRQPFCFLFLFFSSFFYQPMGEIPKEKLVPYGATSAIANAAKLLHNGYICTPAFWWDELT